jgi:hypothetical protein
VNKSKIGIIVVGIIIITGVIMLISNQESISKNITDDKVTEQVNAVGNFQIDKKQYNVGEKIFLDMDYIQSEDKGVILFLRPINDTHRTTYMAIPFDGAQKTSYSYYLEPQLDEDKEICSMEDLTGKWSIVFFETKYRNIEFEIKNQISDWDKRTFEPVC